MATSCACVRRHPTPPESSRALPQGLDPRTGHGDPKQVTQKPQQPAGGRSASHSSMTQRGPADGVRAQLQRLGERAVGAPEPLRRPAQRPAADQHAAVAPRRRLGPPWPAAQRQRWCRRQRCRTPPPRGPNGLISSHRPQTMNPPRTPTNARERTGPAAYVPAPAGGHTGHPGASRRRAGPCTPLLVPT